MRVLFRKSVSRNQLDSLWLNDTKRTVNFNKPLAFSVILVFSFFSFFSFGDCELIEETGRKLLFMDMYESIKSNKITVDAVVITKENFSLFFEELYYCPQNTSLDVTGKTCAPMEITTADSKMPITVVRVHEDAKTEVSELLSCYTPSN